MPSNIQFHFKQPEESPGFLLWQVTMLWQRKMNRVLDPLDLTHTQFVLLASLGWLLKNNDQVTQVDIANHSNTDRMMVSKVLRTLENKSYIERREHPVDTRAKIITLTKNGEKILRKALKAVEQTDNLFFSPLGTRQNELNTCLLQILQTESNLADE